jgi:hypothetical protein
MALLRVLLVASGGQYYWPDEKRYDRSLAAANALWRGDIHGGLRALNRADHFLFKVIGVVPATMQIIIAPSAKTPALFFSLFSVVSLWLMWGIMRRIGESRRSALYAVGLLAVCSTFLYYSRHLLPYDTAMSIGLLALFVGLRTPSRDMDSILCGLLSACAFLTYNGYWILAGFAMLLHTLWTPRTLGKCTRRALISGISFAVLPGVMLAANAAAGGDLLQQFVAFSRTGKQGLYSEGWSLPWVFLWHAEHFLILLWAVALINSLREAMLGRASHAVVLGLSGVIFIYGILVIFSVVLQKYVVYGRLVRQLVPFCSILAAVFLEQLWRFSPKGKSIAIAILTLTVLQATLNFRQPLAQVFPPEFHRLASQAMDSTEKGEYEVLFDHHIYRDVYREALRAKDGRTIIQKDHPLQFLPYQFEGFTPEERAELQSSDISMRLILKMKQ